MIWLLGEPEDTDLLWLAVFLQRRGVPVEFILVDDLLVASTFAFRIDTAGVVSSFALPDGRAIRSDMPGLVINRITGIPPIGGTVSAADAAYLGAEWQAAMAAWLRTLQCPVLNPPRAGSLIGPEMAPAAWRRVASAHGVPAHAWASADTGAFDGTVDVVLLGSHCLPVGDALPAAARTGLAALARFVGAPLLGATFARRGDDWAFVEATACPHFAAAGEQFVDALIEYAGSEQVLQ